jgi:glycosyl-4,4'-diaponeurosporenoate acyltransferase
VLVPLDWPVAVLVDVVVWPLVSLAAGWWWARRPDAALAGTGWLTRLRPFEARGTWYERVLHVRRWKGWLPEAGSWFGGTSKRSMPKGGLAVLRRECVRAELVHWTILAATPLFAVWNPPGLFAAMVVFAVVANLPCIVVPRFTRARIAALGR